MSANYTMIEGRLPLLISMPHNGEKIPEDIAENMTDKALQVPDTDWNLDRLYSFAQAMGVYLLKPVYSRYVIDLNRDPEGENLYPGANSTELCPTTAFDQSSLYQPGREPSAEEIQRRIELYWQPYHRAVQTTLQAIKQQYGCAVLLEAHSIKSHVPRFFEGQLPDFNLGTSDGTSCSEQLSNLVQSMDYSPYSNVLNGRFKGGFITRNYGQPEQNIHAIQLELSQRTYMDESVSQYNPELANTVIPKLKSLVDTLLNYANEAG